MRESGCQKSLCNRSFLLFPGVATEGESSLGEVNLDSRWAGGVDGATRTQRKRERVVLVLLENRGGEYAEGNGGQPR